MNSFLLSLRVFPERAGPCPGSGHRSRLLPEQSGKRPSPATPELSYADAPGPRGRSQVPSQGGRVTEMRAPLPPLVCETELPRRPAGVSAVPAGQKRGSQGRCPPVAMASALVQGGEAETPTHADLGAAEEGREERRVVQGWRPRSRPGHPSCCPVSSSRAAVPSALASETGGAAAAPAPHLLVALGRVRQRSQAVGAEGAGWWRQRRWWCGWLSVQWVTSQRRGGGHGGQVRVPLGWRRCAETGPCHGGGVVQKQPGVQLFPGLAELSPLVEVRGVSPTSTPPSPRQQNHRAPPAGSPRHTALQVQGTARWGEKQIEK